MNLSSVCAVCGCTFDPSDRMEAHYHEHRELAARKPAQVLTPLADSAEATAADIRRNGDALGAIQEALDARLGVDTYAGVLRKIQRIVREWDSRAGLRTTDYCGQCGESPESATHVLPHGHAWIPATPGGM